MQTPPLTSYDLVEYPGRPYPQTHPDRLATLALLHGLEPAPPEHCRVLEFGCGDGSNLVPMAFGLPGSEFTGIDLAVTAVEKGRSLAARLGLRNVQLLHGDLREFAHTGERFDYLIAHGVFSWVAAEVREALLAACRRLLAEQGLAFVSYNAYPGGHLRMLLREMMLLEVRELRDPAQRVDQALALLRFLSQGIDADAPCAALVQQELKRVMEHGRGHLFHDDLAEINTPVYFSEFMAQACRHGLQYLSEADYFETQYDFYPEPVVARLDELTARGRLVEREQMLDFLKCRHFRQTVLCRQEAVLDRRPKPELVPRFLLSGSITPTAPVDEVGSPAEVQFETSRHGMLRTTNPLAKAALLCLGRNWPACLSLPELIESIRPSLQREPEAQELGQILWRAFAMGLLELHRHRPPLAREPGERPVASALARIQVETGDVVTSLRHTPVRLTDAASRRLLPLLDGTRDREALRQALAAGGDAGNPDDPLAEFTRLGAEPQRTRLNEGLNELARLALLVE